MKKLLLLCACLLALESHQAVSQGVNPDVVVVHVSEVQGPSRLVISRGAGKTQVLDYPNGFSEKSMVAAAELFHQVVTQLYQEGYILQGTLKSGDFKSVLLFIRPPKP